MRALEARHQPYLFKLKLTRNTKRDIGCLFNDPDWLPVAKAGKAAWLSNPNQSVLSFAFSGGLVGLRRLPIPGMRMITAKRRRAMAPPRGIKLLICCS